MPRETKLAAAYADSQPWCIDRDSKVEDICNFIVEYIRSDVLGLLSDRLLVIAGELSPSQNHDKQAPDCGTRSIKC